jgi:hypothetical protein
MRRIQVLCVISLLGGTPLFSTTRVNAQTEDWLAWHGCWQAEGAPAGEYLCIVPDGTAGVRMVTVAGGAVVAESRVITDGRARRVQTEGCNGSEVAFWSADYHRVFLNSELSCEAGVKRQASGIFAITGVASWTSVQAVTIDGRTATRTVTYTAIDDAAAPATVRSALHRNVLDRTSARSTALSPIDADDVNEAVDRIDAAAVQEWLIATGQPFQLADELAPAAADVVTRSALDHAGFFEQNRQQPTREVVRVVERPVEVVHVVERPVYVTHTHGHAYRYRTCWDPFFSGVVVGLGHGVRIGLGHSHCGRSYLTHYSPWGYDLHGWRLRHAKPIIIAGRAIIHHREPNRTPRPIYASPRRDSGRRTPDPQTRPRQDYPVRTAQPRGDSPVTRSAQPRDRTATPGGRTTGRVVSGEVTRPVLHGPVGAGSSTPTRYAQPRTPGSSSTIRAIPSSSSSQPVRTAEPRRSAPPVYAPTTTRSGTRPRGPASSGVTATPRTPQKPAATRSSSAPPSRATTPARIANPRGGEERH